MVVVSLKQFKEIISRSCLIEEFKKRIFSKPGTDHVFSIFNSRDVTFDVAQFKAQKDMYAESKVVKKHLKVRFEGLPDIDEEERYNAKRKRLAKDAPKGAEEVNAWKLNQDDDGFVEEKEKEKEKPKATKLEKPKAAEHTAPPDV